MVIATGDECRWWSYIQTMSAGGGDSNSQSVRVVVVGTSDECK